MEIELELFSAEVNDTVQGDSGTELRIQSFDTQGFAHLSNGQTCVAKKLELVSREAAALRAEFHPLVWRLPA
jgi:hypothetical protein